MAIRRSVAAAAVAAVCLSQGVIASKPQQAQNNNGDSNPGQAGTNDQSSGSKSMCRMYDDDSTYTAETCKVSQVLG